MTELIVLGIWNDRCVPETQAESQYKRGVPGFGVAESRLAVFDSSSID